MDYKGIPQQVDFEPDSSSHDQYPKKLLEPGWGGDLNKAEVTYIKSCIRQSRSLRIRWGFRPSAKRLSSAHIRRVAMYGVCGDGRQVLASAEKNKRRRPMKEHWDNAEGKTPRYEIGPPRSV